MEILGKQQDWRTTDKHESEAIAENRTSKSVTGVTKQKRKAPDIPTGQPPKQVYSVEETFTGNSSTASLSRTITVNSSRESLTSSSSTDYSSGSQSFCSSSTCGSATNEQTTKNLSVRSVAGAGFELSKSNSGFSLGNSTKETVKPNHSITHLPGERLSDENEGNDDVSRLKPEDSNCANISDYVENAILVSNQSSLLSSSPDKSAENLNNVGVSHLPPRLLSFESSSTLNHDGLSKTSTDSAVTTDSHLKPHYVSLDYVRSAAAEGRARRRVEDDDDDDGENTIRSTSSACSSFISSVGSEDGSTIGSDVVENLYNKITAAAARHNVKTALRTSDSNTGDIEKDLFPLVFPGYRQGGRKNGDKSQHTDFIRPPNNQPTSSAKVGDFLHQNFNNNNHRVVEDSVFGSEHPNSSGYLSFDQTVEKCQNRVGVGSDQDNINEEEMHKARELFGQCFCNGGDSADVVTEIDFCNSNLKEVPKEIYEHAQTLTKLLLESNTITDLPKELFVCQNLRYLSVSDNDISSLPASLASLINLYHLDVSKNVIEDLPECIRFCKNLEILDASVNPIERLSEGFTQLISLRELFMNDCFFDFLPANFGRMSQLRVLELRDNQLQILPKSIRRLDQLTRLDLGGNVFQEWPDVISKLTNLSELWLDCNELNTVPCDIGDLTKLTYLDLSRNFLPSIPSQIGSLEHLTDLLLSDNTLTSLPDTIGFLRCLTMMNLESNQITSLPVSIGKLYQLEELDLSHNKLSSLPVSIGNLNKLQALLLDDNKLTELPNQIGGCKELNILQLSRNQIEFLPDSIGDLVYLKVLNICRNRIPYLPITMTNLVGLQALWVSPNQSKPNLPLHVVDNVMNGKRILTNILFPQEEKGISRASKILGSISQGDEFYANDAADDDDLDAYAQRERGKTHVLFDLDATTYSNQDIEMEAADYYSDLEHDEPPTFESSSDTLPIQNDDQTLNTSMEESGSSSKRNLKRVPGVEEEEYSVDVSMKSKNTGLSVFSQSLKHDTPPEFSDETPMMKTASILKVKSGSLDEYSPKYENTNSMDVDEYSVSDKDDDRFRTHKGFSGTGAIMDVQTVDLESVVRLKDKALRGESPPVSEAGIRTWSSHSNLPSVITEQTSEWNPDEEPHETKTCHSLSNGLSDGFSAKPKSKEESFTISNSNDKPVTSDHFAQQTEQRPDSTHESASESLAFNNASNLLDRLEQLAKRNRDVLHDEPAIISKEHQASSEHRTLHTTTAQSSKKPQIVSDSGLPSVSVASRISSVPVSDVPEFQNIPYMDSDEDLSKRGDGYKSEKTDRKNGRAVNIATNGRQSQLNNGAEVRSTNGLDNGHSSQYRFIDKESKVNPGSEDLNEIAKNNNVSENDNFSLSPFMIEAKSSSVTSGESMPATDHDSGVGNDVESQESIPDVHEETNDLDINVPVCKVSSFLHGKDDVDQKSNQVGEIPAVRRNKNGWLAVVRTDNASNKQNVPDKTAKVKSDLKLSEARFSENTSLPRSAISSQNKSLPYSRPTHYVPVATVDSTTVTYSHDYKASRQQADRKSSASTNRVADNIKKFERFFENGFPAPPTELTDEKYKSLPRYNSSSSNVDIPSSTKPVAVATILPTSPDHRKPVNRGHVYSETRLSPDVDRIVAEADRSLQSFTTRPSDTARPQLSQTKGLVSGDTATVSNNSEQPIEFLPTRRQSSHLKKSKFEEALAATKHKHFRDKLEKMMQQQNSSINVSKRLSRSSSSSIASIPRITSPVPHHSATPLERLTAANTEETLLNSSSTSSKSGSVHTRLREKLQSGSSQADGDTGLSRDRAGSSRQFSKRGTVQRSSLRTPNPTGNDDVNEDNSKQTLEERLGQLMLDGASTSPPHGGRVGFVPYVSRESIHHPSVSGNKFDDSSRDRHKLSNYNTANQDRKPPMPVDWKLQLLQHIERKKQEKQELQAIHTLGRSRTVAYNDPLNRSKSPPLPQYSSTSSVPNPSSHSHGHHYGDGRKDQINTDSRRSAGRRDQIHPSMTRSVTAPAVGETAQHFDKSKRQSLSSREQQPNSFVRETSQSKQPGRRSSGRFLRTRTPGPEMNASDSKRTEVAVRPKSAMDMPASFDPPRQIRQDLSDWDVGRRRDLSSQEKPRAVIAPTAAPPSYEDHLLRRAANKQDYHDYVNIEYVNHLRSSEREKPPDPYSTYGNSTTEQRDLYPLRSTGSHESVLNSKTDKTYPYDNPTAFLPGMRSSNSHDSILDNPYQGNPRYQPTHHDVYYSSRGGQPYDTNNHDRGRAERHNSDWKKQYGVIPPPAKTKSRSSKGSSQHQRDWPQTNTQDNYQSYHNHRHHHHSQKEYFIPPPVGFRNDYEDVPPPLSPSLQRMHGDREDESTISAFRPYHQHQQQVNQPRRHQHPHHHGHSYPINPTYEDQVVYMQQHQDVIDHHRYHHHLDRGKPRVVEHGYNLPSDPRHPHRNYYYQGYEEDHSVESDPSLSGEAPRQQGREDDAGIQLVSVMVRKNPTFGFHIMGGIDAGGNPYRVDDDGVFITYVAPGGAADGHVQPGDKILVVNGSDFVGITHKRAVDLLRNAGQVARLVVERLVGRPV